MVTVTALVQVGAYRREGVRLSELIAFVEQCKTASIPDDTELDGDISWRGRLQKVETRRPKGGAS